MASIESQPLIASQSSNRSRSSLIRYYPDTYTGRDDDGDSESDDECSRPGAIDVGVLGGGGGEPKDTLFALVFVLAFLAFVVAGVSGVQTAHHDERDTLRGTVYAALRNSLGALLGAAAAAVLGGVAWIVALAAFVRPLVWASLAAIPLLCGGVFAFVLTDALLGKANDPVILDPQYNAMIGVSFVFLIASFVSGSFLYKERKNIDKAINIIHLACQIIWETPSIFSLSLGILGFYSLFSFAWAFAFSHLFLSRDPSAPPSESLTFSTEVTILYFVFIHFWTTAILSSIVKMTIAGVVGQWYFGRHSDDTFDDDHGNSLVAKSLKNVVGPAFGSVCFASLVVATVEIIQFVVRTVRKNSRGRNSPIINFVDSCMDCTGRAVSQISSYTLIYCGLTGAGVCEGAFECTRLFRRNLVIGMATAGITRTLLFFGASAVAGGVGSGTFFYSARGTGSPYAWVVGSIGAFVPFYIIRFMSQIIQNTVDATFICYMLDVDSNANNCQEAHEIFENDLGI